MLFNSIEFWIFFFVVAGLFYSVPFRFGKILLILASAFFYMWWDPRFIFLLIIPTVIDFYCARYMVGRTQSRKKALLLLSLITNLGLLGFFKYYNFFVSSVNLVAGLPATSHLLNIVLPVGISFYTFNTLSYTIDVYRGNILPIDSITDFALFISFFPHLVAGPIVRAADFLPQISAWKRPPDVTVQSAIDLVLIGLIKKMVFADQFALVADQYFNAVGSYHGPAAAWSGVFAFTMQIFFDFSGYTDIARGLARLFGFEFHLNFARPYLSSNITIFWKRWHISLSTWLRDYLYIPLGGNRDGALMTYRNLMMTMVLGGLWHGASWNFVIWGTLHGGLLALHRFFERYTRGTPFARIFGRPGFKPFKVALTFFVVMIAWVFFRATTLRDSIFVIDNLFAFGRTSQCLLTPALFVMAIAAAFLAYWEETSRVIEKFTYARSWSRISVYMIVFWLIEFFANIDQKIPFVYFQF